MGIPACIKNLIFVIGCSLFVGGLTSANSLQRTSNNELHPIHISVTEFNYSEKDNALQITSRLFIDDLELSIRAKRKDADLDIMEPTGGITTKQLVIDYLTEHFKVTLDGKL